MVSIRYFCEVGEFCRTKSRPVRGFSSNVEGAEAPSASTRMMVLSNGDSLEIELRAGYNIRRVQGNFRMATRLRALNDSANHPRGGTAVEEGCFRGVLA